MCCTVDKILSRSSPPCGFGLSPISRDQPQPGSFLWRYREDPGNEVALLYAIIKSKVIKVQQEYIKRETIKIFVCPMGIK